MPTLLLLAFTQKEILLNKLVDEPLNFTDEDFQLLVNVETGLEFDDLRKVIRRIYDLNENTLRKESDAMLGLMGKFNRMSTAWRQRYYFRKVKAHFRGIPGNKVVVAEGDSWFQFPVFVKDIIDWLIKNKKLAIYSIASGGDWITNMIYEGKYIEELSIHKPDIFLISGGGNDFIGSNRLAVMVDKDAHHPKFRFAADFEPFGLSAEEVNGFLRVQNFINKEFYTFLLTLKAQYWIIFRGLHTPGKFPGLRIITQGYDNVIPSYKKRWSWRYPFQFLVNHFLHSGQWLKQPLQIKGFDEGNTQKWILRYLIFQVNEVFIDLARKFPNVYHIDCRVTARGFEDWFDEIHLKSHLFKQVARAYEKCIFDEALESKIIRVTGIPSGAGS